MAQAIIRRLFVDAAKGDPRAQRLVTEMLPISEDEAPRTAEQPRRTFEIVIVDPKPRQARGRRGGLVTGARLMGARASTRAILDRHPGPGMGAAERLVVRWPGAARHQTSGD